MLGLAMLAAACGDDDSDGGEAAQAETSAASDTTGAAAETTAAGTATSAGGAGAGATATDTSTAGAESFEPCTAERKGGTLTMGTPAPFTGMSPYLLPGTGLAGADYASALYDTLMRYDATTHEFVPNVAESLEPNDDFSEWTLTLRPGVTFGNGDVLTTADVVAHIEKLQTSRVRATGMANEISAMQVTDDRTMVFQLDEAWGTFPYMLATEPGWVPNRRLVAERGDAFATNPAGAGVGPFELERFAAGEEILMRGRDDYWGGPVCIESLSFRNILGVEPTYEAFQQDEFDVAIVNSTTVATEADEAGDVGYQALTGATQYVVMDQGITGRTDSPYTDVRVREAMQLAVDYDLINDRLYDGVGVTTSAVVPTDSVLYHGMEGPPYDPERASQLLEELKADGTWDGHINLLIGNAPESIEMGVLFEGMWEAVGMEVDVESTPESYQRVTLEPNFEVGTQGAAVLDPAPWTALNTLASDSPRSRDGFADPAMDEALTELRAASNNDEIIEALKQFQTVWNETFPYIVFNHAIWAVLVQDDVHGMEYGPDVTPYFAKAWIG